MQDKKFWLGAVLVFVVLSIGGVAVNQGIMAGDYEATKQLWRPMEEMKVWVFYVVYAFVAFFFTLIFSKGYEGKGIMEGVRYGVLRRHDDGGTDGVCNLRSDADSVLVCSQVVHQ